VELEDDDRELAARLVEQMTPAAMAAALIHSLRTDMPSPEDILAGGQRSDRGEPGERRTDGGPRPGFEGASWFRLNAGRRHNADPRWLLPLICRYGHVTRTEIGAIRIAANESYFQVSERATQGFLQALRRAKIAPEDQGLMIELAEPREGSSTYRPELAHEKPTPKKKPRGPRTG
jgi:ATP-dependent RNA helicase DeaD